MSGFQNLIFILFFFFGSFYGTHAHASIFCQLLFQNKAKKIIADMDNDIEQTKVEIEWTKEKENRFNILVTGYSMEYVYEDIGGKTVILGQREEDREILEFNYELLEDELSWDLFLAADYDIGAEKIFTFILKNVLKELPTIQSIKNSLREESYGYDGFYLNFRRHLHESEIFSTKQTNELYENLFNIKYLFRLKNSEKTKVRTVILETMKEVFSYEFASKLGFSDIESIVTKTRVTLLLIRSKKRGLLLSPKFL